MSVMVRKCILYHMPVFYFREPETRKQGELLYANGFVHLLSSLTVFSSLFTMVGE